MKKLSPFALLLLAGCGSLGSIGTSADPIYLPDGTAGYHITCGGYFGSIADCIHKAGDMCGPHGYQMYDAVGKPLKAEAQDQSVIVALNTARRGQSSDAEESMFIKCKPAAPIATMAPASMAPVPAQPSVETWPVPLAPNKP